MLPDCLPCGCVGLGGDAAQVCWIQAQAVTACGVCAGLLCSMLAASPACSRKDLGLSNAQTCWMVALACKMCECPRLVHPAASCIMLK